MRRRGLRSHRKKSSSPKSAFEKPAKKERLKMRGAIQASSEEMSLLQTMVSGAAAQSSAAAVLFGSAVPKGKESHRPKAMARQTGESQPLAWAGGSGAGPSLADKSSGVLEAWVCCRFLVCPRKKVLRRKRLSARGQNAGEGGTLQAYLGSLPCCLLFMGRCFSACRREAT